MQKINDEFSSGELKAIALCVTFMIEDVSEELNSYEEARMDEAAQTSRDVLSGLYRILNKVRDLTGDA
jgi:hypothetical protein